MAFTTQLQELVREFGINELNEIHTDRKFQSALLTHYIDENWEVYLDFYIEVIQELKSALRERVRGHADSNQEIDEKLDQSFTAMVNSEVSTKVIDDFEGYWYEGSGTEIVSAKDYEMRIRRACAGDCGICLRCMNTESNISNHEAEVA